MKIYGVVQELIGKFRQVADQIIISKKFHMNLDGGMFHFIYKIFDVRGSR